MIGFFDSGLGGLSILREVRALLPYHDAVYLADSAYCPYGPRPLAEIRQRSLFCGRWLIEQGAQLIVVACNTATSAAIELLRASLSVPIVGIEPGIKPAVALTRTGHVGVLATSSTLGGERLATLVERYANGVDVHTLAAPGMVTLVEQGDLASPTTRATVANYLVPLQETGCDTIVLGCTHFPFLRPLIEEVAGSAITIVDTGPAVATRAAQLVAQQRISPGTGSIRFATTGEAGVVAPALARVWGAPVAHVETV
jgi:glutamate racemase